MRGTGRRRARAGSRATWCATWWSGCRDQAFCSGPSTSRPGRSHRWTRIRRSPRVDREPPAAWAIVSDAIQRALDDPAVAERVEDCGPPGTLSFDAAVDMTCTPDVLIHTWDLARATGLDERLDAGEVHRQLVGMLTMPPEVDEAMRSSGQFGSRIAVADDADEQTRLLAFMGRKS